METGMARALGSLALGLGAVLLIWFLNWRGDPDVVNARLCAGRYRAATTTTDSARIDSLRTATRQGISPHTCGELRRMGRTR